jgi:coenzyme F420-0:L-glutamate ligase / coenzyme F420-1:gamma-L-glutamate ligase
VSRVELVAIAGLPAVRPGDDLAQLIDAAAVDQHTALADGVLVVCQKIVSKAEGRIVPLAGIEPSDEARRIAAEDGKDPRHIELVLRESVRIVRRGHRTLITETRHGFVCANSGVDLSNAPEADTAVLLPLDPDASARALRAGLEKRGHGPLAVIVSDTFGRPWREGLVEVALGCAGMDPLLDLRGRADLAGRELHHTVVALADEVAAAAGLVMEKDSAVAAAIVRGVRYTRAPGGAAARLVRKPEFDLFR